MTKYHFIGIGGIGMSALARILLDKKIPVSGSDVSSNENIDQLAKKGAKVCHGHSAKHVSPKDTIVFSSGIQKSNPEYQAALALKCPMLHRSELLARLMDTYQTLAVAGTHGKTTTSSLLSSVLVEGGLDPSFAVGGMVSGINGKLGEGKYFVAEADESDGSFLNYSPQGAIITNIEPEHLDHYKTVEHLHHAFKTFLSQVENQDLLFYWGDDPFLPNFMQAKGVSYGFGKQNQLRLEAYRQEGWNSIFNLHHNGKTYQDIKVALAGEHNALNAAAVFGLALKLKISEETIRTALEKFPGIDRRCEKKGEASGVLLVDDYAHHPTEIEKTLWAVKQAVKEKRLVVVFQPHRYSRTQDHFLAFSQAFNMADKLYVTDIYAAGEQPIEGIDSPALIKKIQANSTTVCTYLPRDQICEELKQALRPHDVLLTVGAGDITRLHAELLRDFNPKKHRVGLVFGGLSCEHEISLRSARFVSDSLNREFYEVHYFGIDKRGKWITGDEAKELLFSQPSIETENARSILDPQITYELQKCDLFLPILHGTFGEDGTIQGFFEMLGKPYIGPDYRAAAISMDKVLTKRLVASKGVRTPKDIAFGYLAWAENHEQLLQKIRAELIFPLYIKPIHLGSSVGISCVESEDQLKCAIDLAFRYDTQVMVEEGVVDCRELEFAVMGNTQSFPCIAPAPGEKIAAGTFVDYERKYGENTVKTTLNPEMPSDWIEKGQKLAQEAYEAVGCSGMTRVDFLLDPSGEFWFFEMNPIPGLQKFSLFPKIWQREGVCSDALFDRLVVLALERNRQQNRHFKCLA